MAATIRDFGGLSFVSFTLARIVAFSCLALHSVNVQKFVADLQISGLLPEFF